VGSFVGETLGGIEGFAVGSELVGETLGISDGLAVGMNVGSNVGLAVVFTQVPHWRNGEYPLQYGASILQNRRILPSVEHAISLVDSKYELLHLLSSALDHRTTLLSQFGKSSTNGVVMNAVGAMLGIFEGSGVFAHLTAPLATVGLCTFCTSVACCPAT